VNGLDQAFKWMAVGFLPPFSSWPFVLGILTVCVAESGYSRVYNGEFRCE